jgi:AraC family transcriptional regulator, positive regulator of tynA and feaB
METFSTKGIPVARKLSFWNEIASDVFAMMEVRARDAQRFYGRLDRERVGPVTLVNVYSAAVRIRHAREHIARIPAPTYLLLTPEQHDMQLTSEGSGTIRVRAGEFCLIDQARAYEVIHGDAVRTFCIDVPRQRLDERMAGAQNVVGQLVRPESRNARVLLALMRSLGNEVGRCGEGGLSPATGESLLGLIAATFTECLDPRAARGIEARARAFRDYIESRLTDPELKPNEVAFHFGISPRYLRTVLSADGEGFSSYILRRRLERCARLLRDPDWSRINITEIAFQSGFSNVTHFGQAFKARYGLTPRDYRFAPR